MKKIIFFLFIAFALFSCNETTEKIMNSQNIKPSSSGSVSEITVIIDENLWKSDAGDSVFYYLSQPFYGLPQDEPTFKVVHLPEETKQNVYKTNRNLLIIKVKDTLKPNIKFQNDLWATNQLVITITAKNKEEFLDVWNKNKREIYLKFFNEEIERYQKAFKSLENKDVIDSLKNRYAIYLVFPNDYKIYDLKQSFAWIEKNTLKSIQAVFIDVYPFKNENQFYTDSVIIRWDKLLKAYVPGPKEGTYPAIEPLYPLRSEVYEKDNQKALIYRGLWKTEGGFFMGGPCLIYQTYDKKHNRIISLFALIYGGKQNKKLFVWQTEAILKSLEIL